MRKQVEARYYDGERSEMLPFIPSGAHRILELGCANGRFAAGIKERQVAEIWGVEINPEAAARAAHRLDRVIQSDIHSALEKLPFAYFDCVVCNDILEHLPDPETILEKLRKYITPTGVIVASIPNIRYLPVLFELLVMKDFKYRNRGVLDNTHLRFFTRKSIQRLFMNSGYELLKMQGLHARHPLYQAIIIWLMCIFTLGYYNDTRFKHFACVAMVSPQSL